MFSKNNLYAKSLMLLMFLSMTQFIVSAKSQAGQGQMTLYKNPDCGCCTAWGQAFQQAGYQVLIQNIEDMDQIKNQFQIVEEMQSCHTAVMAGYVIEGHVHPQAISKMLIEQPDIKGIAVPGMPEGTLGMGYDPAAEYMIYALEKNKSVAFKPYLFIGQE